MTSIYDFDKLAKLLNSLYLLTGRKITLKDSDFNNVITSNTACEFCRLIQSTPFGYEKCLACDTEALAYAKRQNKAYLYRCHAGLMEAAVPVMEKGRLLAYLMYGQVLDESPLEEQWARIKRQCAWHEDLPRSGWPFTDWTNWSRRPCRHTPTCSPSAPPTSGSMSMSSRANPPSPR